MTHPKLFSIAFLLLFTLLGIPTPAAEKVDVQADSLNVQNEQRIAQFKGNVRAKFKGLRFYCAELTVRYNENGEIVSLNARGKITVLKDGAKATAQAADLNVHTNTLRLTGSPKLTRDGNTLEGKRIEVNIQTGHIEVTEAKGTFIFSRSKK